MQNQAPASSREHHPIRCITLVKAAAVALLALLVSCGEGGGGTEPRASIATDAKSGMHVDVAPLFPKNGAKWNDYVRGDVSTATDTACNAVTDTACLHGGERRVVVIKSKTSCSGLVATDDLGAFNWACDDSGKRLRLISAGLADGKFLSDLIDFTTRQFKPNKVTVKANGVVWIVTPSTIWWTNPVVENNSGGSLAAPSTVYLVTQNPRARYFPDADKVALVIQPGVTLTGPGTNEMVIYSNHHNLWLEGTIDARGEFRGVILDSVRFSVLRNVAVDNTDVGIVLDRASNNMLSGVTANNHVNVGIVLVGASRNTLSGLTANNNTNHGVLLDFGSNNNTLSGVTASNNTANNGVTLANASNNNTLSGVTANNNAANGVLLVGASNNNTLSGVTTSNNNAGVTLANASNNKLSGVTASNNALIGVGLVDGATNNTLSGVTASNNILGVFLVNASNNNTLSGVTASNNANWGVLINIGSNNNTVAGVAASNNYIGVGLVNHSDNETFSDVVAGNNDLGVILSESSNNRFTGLLRVGNNSSDCSVSGGMMPGLEPYTYCANNGSSDATLTLGITLAGSFVGKVTSDDTQNANDSFGTAAFPLDPAVFDWTHFDNAYRGWGLDGSAFPDQFQRGRWTAGTGRIWDWSASSGDSGNSGSPALRGVLALPTGNDTLTQIWSGTPGTSNNAGCNAMVSGSSWNGSGCGTTFLRNAVEIPGDGIGNDNTLCESGETCLYMPNIGSYQGHGNLVSAGNFTSGTLTGITLMKYATNGR